MKAWTATNSHIGTKPVWGPHPVLPVSARPITICHQPFPFNRVWSICISVTAPVSFPRSIYTCIRLWTGTPAFQLALCQTYQSEIPPSFHQVHSTMRFFVCEEDMFQIWDAWRIAEYIYWQRTRFSKKAEVCIGEKELYWETVAMGYVWWIWSQEAGWTISVAGALVTRG